MSKQDLLNARLPTVKQLQCFLAVCQERNFRKAAELLNMTQPPLTRQIQNLEHLIGQTLFMRNTHDVSLTKTGEAFELQAVAILEHLQQATLTATKKCDVKIRCTRVINFENIPAIRKKLNKIQPDLLHAPEHHTSQQLLKNLLQRNVDIAITGEQPIDSDDLSFHYLFTEKLKVAFPSDHPAAAKEKVSMRDLQDLPLYWFARNENPAWYDKCEERFRKLHVSLRKIKEPKELIITLDHISKGRGMALVPESVLSIEPPGCCVRPLAKPDDEYLNIDIYAVIRKNESHEAVLRDLDFLLSD